jgi:hypothetical protein
MIFQSAENNSIVGGESMDVLNGNRRVLNVKLPFGWSNRIVRAGRAVAITNSSNPEGENTRR